MITVELHKFELHGLIDWLVHGLDVGEAVGAPERDLIGLRARIDELKALLP